MKSKFNLIKTLLLMIILSISFTGCFLLDEDDMSAAAKSVAKDKADLEIIYASGDSASSVTQNVTLPAEGARITVITWSSSNTAIIASNGTITCPIYANGTVTLTAMISKENESDTKQFVLEVTNDDPYNLSLRDTGPAGGLIFYINPNASADGWKYLEAAPEDQDQGGVKWSNDYTPTGATGIAVGTGSSNTQAIMSSQGEGVYAAKLCDDLMIDGYSDWFLPSKDELDKMCVNLKSGVDENGNNYTAVGGLANGYYWSSSENDATSAWFLSFSDPPPEGTIDKTTNYRVRVVRAF